MFRVRHADEVKSWIVVAGSFSSDLELSWHACCHVQMIDMTPENVSILD